MQLTTHSPYSRDPYERDSEQWESEDAVRAWDGFSEADYRAFEQYMSRRGEVRHG